MVLPTMGFFATRKKKPDNVKTLSETEIQQRLYGHLRIPSTTVEDSTFTHRRPAEPSKDFFQKSQSLSETSKTQESAVAQKTMSTGIPAGPTRSRAGWTDSASATQASFKPKREARKNPLAAFPGALLVFFKRILFVSLSALFKLAGSVFRLFISIDFRKPQVQKIASTLGAAAFVGLLFLSTHYLNVGREAAMKSPHPKTTPEIVKRKVPFAPHVKPVAKAPEAVSAADSSRVAEVPAAVLPADTEAPVSPPAAVAKPKPAEQGAYSIQIATFAGPEDAGRLVAKLRAQDADAFIKELDRPGGRTYYCVFVGHYKDFREGEESLSRFKKKSLAKPFLDAFVRVLKPE